MADIEFTNEEEVDKSLSTLGDTIEKTESDLKGYVVNYVGNKLNPENDEITVEMIVDVFSKDFPELVMAVAEENWIRGYQQALHDADEGRKLLEETREKEEADEE
tara:strand:+ start:2654 stop:2968 length:315 start_codon:yes stop_codon:yes gene_type:complete